MVFTEHVKIREEKFGAVIFETLKEKVFVTNESGKDILNLLQQGHSLEKVVESLAISYGAEPLDIREDVTNFVNQLRDNHIISQ